MHHVPVAHGTVPHSARGIYPERVTCCLIIERVEKKKEVIVVPEIEVTPQRFDYARSFNNIVKNKGQVNRVVVICHPYFRYGLTVAGVIGHYHVEIGCHIGAQPVGLINNTIKHMLPCIFFMFRT
jgi:hypothetical protein